MSSVKIGPHCMTRTVQPLIEVADNPSRPPRDRASFVIGLDAQTARNHPQIGLLSWPELHGVGLTRAQLRAQPFEEGDALITGYIVLAFLGILLTTERVDGYRYSYPISPVQGEETCA
jgi:hypothetical protein